MTDVTPQVPRRSLPWLTQGLAITLFAAVYAAALLVTFAPPDWLGTRQAGTMQPAAVASPVE